MPGIREELGKFSRAFRRVRADHEGGQVDEILYALTSAFDDKGTEVARDAAEMISAPAKGEGTDPEASERS
ncbi:hypothetical protein GT755_02985 [Herbidospora sp. NEAU-GS84]|uniref:Uncharacterized protein n=1 Tax=Herbidospora solisilvae TaxID=2696284 RepID=A0A7C9J0D6_9ACTN|nr:hypothetical protein [Herbidospora solisilvae]NAS20647.1 hypothetical protein [Herbidospora solisilvae]